MNKPKVAPERATEQLPSALDSERVVLGGMITDEGLIPVVLETGISVSDFLLSEHRETFLALAIMHEKAIPVDPFTVADKLGGLHEHACLIGKLIDGAVDEPRHLVYHAHLVMQKNRLRRILETAEWITANVHTNSDVNLVVAEIIARLEECRLK